MSVVIQGRCRQALDALLDAFYWKCTPEGHEFWERVSHNIEEIGEITQNPSRFSFSVSEPVDMDVDRAMCNKLLKALGDAFSWSASPQGFDYWAVVAKRVAAIRDGTKISSSHDDYDRAMKGIG